MANTSTVPYIAMIPSKHYSYWYSVYSTYLASVLPEDGSEDFYFSRSTGATYKDADGVLQTIDTDVPALDLYDSPSSLVCEEYAINKLVYSNALDNNDIYTQTIPGSLSISDEKKDPAGGEDGFEIYSNNTSSDVGFYLNEAYEPTAGFQYSTFSIFVKKHWSHHGEHDVLKIKMITSGPGYGTGEDLAVEFDIYNGTIVSEDDGVVGSIEKYCNNWYRIGTTRHHEAADSIGCKWSMDNSDDDDIRMYFYGAQCEMLNKMTSYIPTEGTEVSRDRTKVRKGGWLDDDNFTFYYEANLSLATKDAGGVSLLGWLYADMFITVDYNSFTDTLTVQSNNDGDAYETSVTLADYTDDSHMKIALVVDRIAKTITIYLNGSNIGVISNNVDGSFSIKNVSMYSTARYFTGRLMDMRYYKEGLSEAECLELTTI